MRKEVLNFVKLIFLFLLLLLSELIHFVVSIMLEGLDLSISLIITWLLIITIYVLLKKPIKNLIAPFFIYSFCSYRELTTKPLQFVSLKLKSISLFLVTLLNIFSGSYLLSIRTQVWKPLFKRGGYLSLLNSSRSRWQLSKSNSIFKNK